MRSVFDRLRPGVRAMAGYTPGEQPREGDVVKLNTNENPYPPSPRVAEAIREALTGERLRKYPDPIGTRFRQAAGQALDVDPDGVVIGNGSDDILTILTRAFVPEGGLIVSPTPSYLLYRTLAELQGARFQTVAYTADWDLPSPWPVREAEPDVRGQPELAVGHGTVAGAGGAPGGRGGRTAGRR
ncbi:MAG: aminotransferase class I/II-fold pyridoxal phosphate-dependent enzyme [Gemmataceae bacterium]